ncbi:hypothetical protein [Corynebacterium sp. 335C]
MATALAISIMATEQAKSTRAAIESIREGNRDCDQLDRSYCEVLRLKGYMSISALSMIILSMAGAAIWVVFGISEAGERDYERGHVRAECRVLSYMNDLPKVRSNIEQYEGCIPESTYLELAYWQTCSGVYGEELTGGTSGVDAYVEILKTFVHPRVSMMGVMALALMVVAFVQYRYIDSILKRADADSEGMLEVARRRFASQRLGFRDWAHLYLARMLPDLPKMKGELGQCGKYITRSRKSSVRGNVDVGQAILAVD